MAIFLYSMLQIMDIIFIKEEQGDSDSSAPSNSTSTPTTFYDSSTTSTNSTSYPPTQRVLPSNQSARQGVSANKECVNTQETELLDKVKKLLWLMIIFGENISATAGAIVKRNATSLVVSRDKECLDITFSLQEGSTSVPEFLRQLQLITAFPVRPFVLPFLQSNIHRCRQQVNRSEVFLSGYSFSLLINKL
jgi:hypothetical protein